MACMEDVLDLYAEPYDPKRPVVNFDETSKQLVAEKKTPIPPRRGRRERFDYEYKRNGTRNLFMCCEPLVGWRHVAVTERRTMVDFAHQMRWLVDEAYPEAEKIRVVLDNLNIHKPASLYQAFRPDEARRIRTLPSTAAGSTWRRLSSASSADNVWLVASAMRISLNERSLPWRPSATMPKQPSTGDSPPWTPESSLSVSIPQFQLDEVLALNAHLVS